MLGAKLLAESSSDCPCPGSPAADEASDPGPAWRSPRGPGGRGSGSLWWRHLVGTDGYSRLRGSFPGQAKWVTLETGWGEGGMIRLLSRFLGKVRLQNGVKIRWLSTEMPVGRERLQATRTYTRTSLSGALPCGC